MSLEHLQAAVSAAHAAHAAHAEQMQQAADAVAAAKRAIDQYRSDAATHPLDGKRVFVEQQERTNIWDRNPKTVRYEGIGEVVRTNSEFAANLSDYSHPKIGVFIVRKIKKDGSTSLQFFNGRWDWQEVAQ